ncbi:MAG: DNA polymerase III subunit [Prolixibacteraceae bacterium]|nr:MAG: DNA polymerase III subunit [Prolixibacteraceae bacterium]
MEPIFTNQTLPAAKTDAPARQVIQPPAKPAAPAGDVEIRKIARRNLSNLSSPSIKDALEGKLKDKQLTAREQHQMYAKDGEKEDFTTEKLKLTWEAFLTRLNDRPNLQSTLSTLPGLKEDYQLVLEIENTVQEDLISTIKPELVSWLRKELKNSKIQLTTIITEKVKGRIIYSDAEKYEELLKENPSLGLLRQKLNLDFGH